MARLIKDAGVVEQSLTEQLRRVKKIPAKNHGDFSSALLSAAYYAKKTGKVMYAYLGNSYGHLVYRVSDKASEYLNPINNTSLRLLSVSPELEVRKYELSRNTVTADDIARGAGVKL